MTRVSFELKPWTNFRVIWHCLKCDLLPAWSLLNITDNKDTNLIDFLVRRTANDIWSTVNISLTARWSCQWQLCEYCSYLIWSKKSLNLFLFPGTLHAEGLWEVNGKRSHPSSLVYSHSQNLNDSNLLVRSFLSVFEIAGSGIFWSIPCSHHPRLIQEVFDLNDILNAFGWRFFRIQRGTLFDN